MTLINTEKLIGEMIEKRRAHLSAKIRKYPANNFRASDIQECDKAMVHSILDWDKKVMHDEGLQAIFDAGNREEENVKARLGYDLGFQFIEQQKPFEIKNRNGEVICRGHIDGKILYNGEAIPVEIKSMNENVFNSIRSLDDFYKKPLHRRYLKQMQMYLYGNNEEAGIFILSNFRTEKLIPVIIDLGECEQILQKLERNWEMVKRKEYPAPIEYNEQLCGRCAFKHLCLTEVKHEGAKFIDNAELEARLERREELKTAVDEYKDIDENIKGAFEGIPQAFVGKSWEITGRKRIVKRVNTKAMPDDVKKPYEVESESWITNIVKIA